MWPFRSIFFFSFWALINWCVLLTVTPIILRKIQGLPGGNFIDLGRINAIPPVLNGINLLLGIYNFLYSPRVLYRFFFVRSSIVFSNCCMTQPETEGLTGGIVLDCYSFNFCF